jgi:hypothetical protein
MVGEVADIAVARLEMSLWGQTAQSTAIYDKKMAGIEFDKCQSCTRGKTTISGYRDKQAEAEMYNKIFG